MSNDNPDGESTSETREQGVEFGDLKSELESHDYPTTRAELVSEYGDWELDLPDGSETLESILAERETGEGETVEFESAGDVHQTVITMVGDQAVGRTDYSDRGGALQDEVDEGESQSDQSL